MLKLFKEIDKIKGEVDVDKDVDKLDQTCDYTKPGICLDLQKRLVECWRDRHINQKISQDADYLFTIFKKSWTICKSSSINYPLYIFLALFISSSIFTIGFG